MKGPVLIGLMFADSVIIEQNGKKCVIGSFNKMRAASFPIMFPPWSIYAGLTEINGKHEFELKLYSDQKEDVFTIAGNFDSSGNDVLIEIVPRINQAVFKKMGKYKLDFLIDNKLFASRWLFVEDLKLGKE